MKTIYGDVIVEGSSTILLRIAANRLHHTFSLHDCLHIPDAPHHGLLSIQHLMDHNYLIVLAGRSLWLILDHKEHQARSTLLKYFPLSCSQAQFFLKATFVMPNLTPDPTTRPLTTSVSSTTLQSGPVMSTAILQPIGMTAVPLSWLLSPPTCLS